MNEAIQKTEPIQSLIEKAAFDPNFDAGKLEKLMAMQERWEAHEREIAFNEAYALMEPELPRLTKSKKISYGPGKPEFAYTPLETIDTFVRPLFRRFGFMVYYNSELVGQQVAYTGTLKHSLGHSRKATLILPADTSGGKNSVQAIGSTTSYARRYLLCMLLNLVAEGEDDDARSAEPITSDEAYDLKMALEAAGGNQKEFLEKVAHAETFEKIQRRDLEKCQTQIRKKHKTTHKETAQ